MNGTSYRIPPRRPPMSASLSAYTGATEAWWLTLLESSRRKEIKNEPHSINILIGALPGPTRIIPQVSQVSKNK